MSIIKKVDVTITASPQELAEAFCSMDSDEQAEFFSHCHAVNKRWTAEWNAGNKRGFFVSGMQWNYIGSTARDLGMYGPAAEVIMDIAAPLYLYTLGFRFGKAV